MATLKPTSAEWGTI